MTRIKPFTKKEVRAMLPDVGDRRKETMTYFTTNPLQKREPQPCVVVSVNRRHLWYMVQFENGFRECYKLPVGALGPLGGVGK